MFEMFATIIAACTAAIYALSRSIFMNGPHRNIYRAALVIFLLVIYLIHRIYRFVKFRQIRKMNVNLEDYLYYDKYTSPLYRIAYYISYLIQNILFDYTYMRRNYNFCKGLDVYDGGVSEYYIKFRNTWYRYLKLANIRHRISLKKLQAFACDMKNELIIASLSSPEEKEQYHSFDKEIKEYFKEHSQEPDLLREEHLKNLSYYETVAPLFRKNLIKHCRSVTYAKKYEPELIAMVEKQNFRKERDINDYKKTNFR